MSDKKKILILRPYNQNLNINDLLVKLFIRSNAKFANIINYNTMEELFLKGNKEIVSVPMANLFSFKNQVNKKGEKQREIQIKLLLKQYTSVESTNILIKIIFYLLKMQFPKKYYALLSMVNTYIEFGGQERKNILQLEFENKNDPNHYDEIVGNIIKNINSEGFLLLTKTKIIFLGTEIKSQKEWILIMKKALLLDGVDKKSLNMQIFKGYSWIQISWGKSGKGINGVAEIIADTSL